MTMGMLWSSPADIDDQSGVHIAGAQQVDDAIGKLVAAPGGITSDRWQEFGRTEYEDANGKAVDGLREVKTLLESLAKALDGLARESFSAAIVCAAVGTTLLPIAWLTNLGRFFGSVATAGLGALGAQAAGGAAAQAAQAPVKRSIAKRMVLLAVSSALLIGVQMLCERLLAGDLKHAATPADGKLPDFKKIQIEGLENVATSGSGDSPAADEER
ncbi:hypothetical protein FH608_004105 [Nonomuraea phyllanthi]|uniref:Uncharacterized protein n=1 Tax=Nonomuraea phyllanthi TaxID=2219224 RepID=A0A5C4WVW3_9ACTN|nr:hypothetical protein [Nonomuraea phyllanthi]KAB8197720.1 hypothetical protein FH608_004105 [Nonomuraea phyllanthi]QFY06303.1 hypothetical protein GBF35_06090 [Nonomuraea phyllanthi]